MKKILASGVICTLLASQLSAFAFTDVENCKYKEEIEFFEKEGIVKGKGDEKFYPEDLLTRAETAKICAGIIPENYIDETKLLFSDVLPEHWAVKEIGMASLIINSLTPEYDAWFPEEHSQRLFYPEKTVTAGYVIEACLTILGYAPKEDEPDIGYENAFEKAEKCGLLEGVEVTFEQEITRAEAMKIFYNTINAPVVITHGMTYNAETGKYITNAKVMDGSSEDTPLTTLWMYINEE